MSLNINIIVLIKYEEASVQSRIRSVGYKLVYCWPINSTEKLISAEKNISDLILKLKLYKLLFMSEKDRGNLSIIGYGFAHLLIVFSFK
jgi:hypothetical protein